jgi:hypothetical protein
VKAEAAAAAMGIGGQASSKEMTIEDDNRA